ncbi:AAA family ATPase [Flavilitoribacter nigricans]|uniref:ATPase n=1 Tax=Flavilitoribacter nigricans (strain ATCC 23147 / DSM 23189 / NBRC 102662 / NCIMB 1420 / SS-2) TaxID=1122177 RepID=A0A2D0NBJ1_FLAN2|nr:AAA family ATPase [Flavilitoribacter nigricans]PHN05881.1 ATPase [Flavilitoribacter nigricans DSM 23189 = NBRC 102662]
MLELHQAFNSYNEFAKETYFALCFNALPSKLTLSAPLKPNKEHSEQVLDQLNPEEEDLEELFRHWNTENSSSADFTRDFPARMLFKSRTKNLLVWISLEYESLEIVFYYDLSDADLGSWVVQKNHQLRGAFGVSRTPVFKVLSHNKHCFFTEDVRTDEFKTDVEKFYNDDFREVDDIILQSLAVEKAGLILLHGDPGTGKTSYIKSLITRFADKTFIFIQNEFVNELLHPDFISFMLKNRNAILIIEDAEKVIMSRDQVHENSVVSTILQLTDGLFSDFLNIKIICTFNTSIDRIDKALLRKGRMIAYYEFKPLSNQKTNELMEELGLQNVDEGMTLADIFNYRDKEFRQEVSRKIGFENGRK